MCKEVARLVRMRGFSARNLRRTAAQWSGRRRMRRSTAVMHRYIGHGIIINYAFITNKNCTFIIYSWRIMSEEFSNITFMRSLCVITELLVIIVATAWSPDSLNTHWIFINFSVNSNNLLYFMIVSWRWGFRLRSLMGFSRIYFVSF